MESLGQLWAESVDKATSKPEAKPVAKPEAKPSPSKASRKQQLVDSIAGVL